MIVTPHHAYIFGIRFQGPWQEDALLRVLSVSGFRSIILLQKLQNFVEFIARPAHDMELRDLDRAVWSEAIPLAVSTEPSPIAPPKNLYFEQGQTYDLHVLGTWPWNVIRRYGFQLVRDPIILAQNVRHPWLSESAEDVLLRARFVFPSRAVSSRQPDILFNEVGKVLP